MRMCVRARMHGCQSREPMGDWTNPVGRRLSADEREAADTIAAGEDVAAGNEMATAEKYCWRIDASAAINACVPSIGGQHPAAGYNGQRNDNANGHGPTVTAHSNCNDGANDSSIANSDGNGK